MNFFLTAGGKNMSESRNHIVKFRVDDIELNYLQEKMLLAKCKSMSDFLRRISLGGKIYNVDMKEFVEIKKLMVNIANNINQIAMRVNFQKTIYGEDIGEIKRKVEEIWQQLNYIQLMLHKLEK